MAPCRLVECTDVRGISTVGCGTVESGKQTNKILDTAGVSVFSVKDMETTVNVYSIRCQIFRMFRHTTRTC